MTTTRELLEGAAKAAGIVGHYAEPDAESHIQGGICIGMGYCHGCGYPELIDNCVCDPLIYWAPLTDDGDAFRLAVKLKMNISQVLDRNCVEACVPKKTAWCSEKKAGDHYAATRLAIVRAAYEISKKGGGVR